MSVVQCRLVGALSDAQCLCGDPYSGIVEGVHGDGKAIAGFFQDIPNRHLAVFQQQRAGVARADSEFVLLFADREAFERLLDDESGCSTVLLLAVVGMADVLGEKHVDVGIRSVGHPHLLAVEHVVTTIIAQLGLATQSRRISPRAGLGKRVGADIASSKARKVLLLLLLVTVQCDGFGAQSDMDAEHHGE